MYNSTTVERHQFDAEYMERLARGDRETESHFTAYFGKLLSIKLRSRGCSASQLDDIRQETFLRVIRMLRQQGGIRTPEALGAYVNSVCNNVALEIYRAESRGAELPDQCEAVDTDVESGLVREQEREAVREVLAELPERDRTLLRWIFLEERDKDEICGHLQVDRGYLRVLLHRARLRFREVYLKRQESQSRSETNRRSTTQRG